MARIRVLASAAAGVILIAAGPITPSPSTLPTGERSGAAR
jgi:hypothetical protein